MTTSREIDTLLAGLPADQRAALQSLRETVAAAAPDAVETFSYGLPRSHIASIRWSRTRLPRSTARCTS